MLEFLLCACCLVWLFGKLPNNKQEDLKKSAQEAKNGVKGWLK